MKKVLIFEPNPYHNEVLPGLVKYFEDLDYIADVYVREECYSDNAFCRYRIKGERKAYKLDNAKLILSDEKIKEYDFIFFSSMEHCEDGDAKRFLTEIGFIPKTKYGVLGMYHGNRLIDEFNDRALLDEGRLFCISAFQTKEYSGLQWMSPIYFCNIDRHIFHESEKKRLLIIGNAANFNKVADAWYHLDSAARRQLEIRHIGGIPPESKDLKTVLYGLYCFIKGMTDCSHRSQKFINKLGRLEFNDMYTEIENADFLIAMIDPDSESERHYVEANTSGIRQLAIGFGKPLIINDKVAAAYDIPEAGCIRFTKGTLVSAMKAASEIGLPEYDILIKAMHDAYDTVFKKSLEHLQMTVEKLTGSTED